MKKKYYLLIIISFLLMSFSAHKYYLSLTQINYDKKTNALQVKMKVFMDDLQTSILKKSTDTFELNTPNEPKDIDTQFKNYLKENFTVKINDEYVDYTFLGKEYEGDIVFFYIEIEDVKKIKSIEIKNEILISDFPEQQNYIKLNINKVFKSLLLTQKERSGVLKF